MNERQCRTAVTKDKNYKLFDGEGLYLEITPAGRKHWRMKYRLHGKERRISLGTYPDVTLAQARQNKDGLRAELKNGCDPVIVRFEKKQIALLESSQTLKFLALEWHKNGLDGWDPEYAETILHRLEKYVFPSLGKYPINYIRPVMILACLRIIEKTAPEMARRVKQLISHIFRYAIVTDRADRDPTIGLETALKKYKRGHFASIDIDELPGFLQVLYNYRSRLHPQTFLAIRLMLLTFLRTSELIEGRWDEVDFDRGLWIIPAQRMKMENAHLVPLSKQAIEILKELRELNPYRDLIFPGIPRPQKPMSKGTILVALKRMGYSRRMTGHGFRSLALGVLKEKLEVLHEIADRQLAHVPKNSVDRAYDRAKFLPQRIVMMQRYADYLDELIFAIHDIRDVNVLERSV